MTRTTVLAALSVLSLVVLPSAPAREPTIDPLVRTIDLDVGQEADVTLCDGSSAKVQLLDLDETRDDLRQAVRLARATVVVNGQRATITSGNYNLPIRVGDVQIELRGDSGVRATWPEPLGVGRRRPLPPVAGRLEVGSSWHLCVSSRAALVRQ